MQIKTNRGKTFDALFAGAILRNGNRMMIELKDDRAFSEIAADFDGLDTITRTEEARPGVSEVYEGFSRLIGIALNEQTGTVRITLSKP